MNFLVVVRKRGLFVCLDLRWRRYIALVGVCSAWCRLVSAWALCLLLFIEFTLLSLLILKACPRLTLVPTRLIWDLRSVPIILQGSLVARTLLLRHLRLVTL